MSSYVFGPFRLDLRGGELRKSDESVALEPRVFSLLAYLLERRGELVPRSELMDVLWPDTHVSDASLSQAVSSLRDALEDDAAAPRYIETVPKRGYRFLAAVIEESRPVYRVTCGAETYILASGENVIGRSGDAAIRIRSKRVSRHHARIVITAHGATIEDLGSRNGTVVNGEAISDVRTLADDSQILIGDVALLFHSSVQSDTAETAGS